MVDRVESSNAVGQQLGNYRLLSVLNRESNATTYLGIHVHLRTQVAVRVYQTQLLQSDQEYFLAEVQAAARLVHPHIVRVLEFGVEGEAPFLVTAYTPGCTLRERYAEGTVLSLSTIVPYVKQLASALDYAHSMHLLHLDLKPEHLWLSSAGEVLVSDFRVTLLSHNSHTQSIHEIAHAVAYMAPEQIQGHPVAASDQYALAILVYEWLSGSRPFPGSNYVELASQHISTSPPALVTRVPGLSLATEQVVMKALAKHADTRFPTIQAFADALEQSYLAGSTEHATPQTRNNVSRRAMTLGLVGAAGVLAAGGGVYWFSRSSHATHVKAKTPQTKPVARGTILATYRGHSDVVYGVDWSRDGKQIASWSLDGTMQVWSATTFAHVDTLPMTNVISWSPDWRYMASGDYIRNFQLWDATTGRIIALEEFPFTGAGPEGAPIAISALWSPDGKHFIMPVYSAKVWEVATGKVVSTYPAGAAGWSPDSKRIALRQTNKVQILDAATENQLVSYTVPASPSGLLALALYWSPNGKYLAADDGTVWEALTGKLIARNKGTFIAWSPNSKYLAASFSFVTSDGQVKSDNAVHIWSIDTGSDVFVCHGHTDFISSMVWSPDGTKIASASYDATVKVWQAV